MNYNRLHHIIQSLIKSGHTFDSVFDIGANQGDWSRHWKNILPQSMFTMFEANPERAKPHWVNGSDRWFNTALSKPGVGTVDFFCAPLSSSGTGDSYYREKTPLYSSINPRNIVASTLDDMMALQNIRAPKLVKIDTQGSEVDILKGSKLAFETVDVCISEVPVTEYNIGAPRFDEYIKAFGEYDMIPVGIDQDHYYQGALIQIDLVFAKQKLIHLIR